MRDRGSMLLFGGLVGLAITGATMAALVPWLGDAIDRQRAQNAADAAALAGVRDGRAGASRLAADNGGVLVSWSRSGRVVSVVVRVDDQSASARATDGP